MTTMQQYKKNSCKVLSLLISFHIIHSLRFSSHSLLFASCVDSETQTYLLPMSKKREGPATLLFWMDTTFCNLHASWSPISNSAFASCVAFVKRPLARDLVTSHAMAGWSSFVVARATSKERTTLGFPTLFCLRRARESGVVEGDGSSACK